MSVFTNINSQQLEEFINGYPVGIPTGFTGIEAGITNSNFFVDTDTGRYVLTIVEHEHPDDVEWFMQLLAFLNSENIPCAQPVKAKSNIYTTTLANKPATLVECLSGRDKIDVDAEDCHAIGQVMAQFHVSCRNYPSQRQDSRGTIWRAATASKVRTKLTDQDQQLLDHVMRTNDASSLEALPASVIHADLFRDNVLFHDDGSHQGANRISGIIDFYYACSGCMLYDLAITFNDWCRTESTTIDHNKATALLAGYESIRPLEQSEHSAFADAVRCAALRFWLSRLEDLHFPPVGQMTYTKDPLPYQKILLQPAANYSNFTT